MIEAEPEITTTAPAKGIPPMTLGVMLIAAFGLGFLTMYAWNHSHQPTPNVVASSASTHPGPRVHLQPPDISVTSSPALTDDERQTVENAIAALSDPNRSDAVDDLESLGEKAIPAVTSALRSSDDTTRANASTVINAIAGGSDDSPNTPADVARMRPMFDQAGTVKSLIALAKDSNEQTRQNVAYALGNIGDTAGYQTLVTLSKDSAPDVRAGVARSLGVLNDLEGIPTLINLLSDPEASVRAVAADGLAPYDTPDAKSALTYRLDKESDQDVIDHIHAALEGRASGE